MTRAFAIVATTFVVFMAIFYLSFVAFAAPPDLPQYAFLQDQPAMTESELAAPMRAAVVPTTSPAVDPAADWSAVADQVFNALALGLIGWVIKLIGPAVLRAGDWIGLRAQAEDLLRDEKMTGMSKILAMQGLDFALGRLGYTREDLKDVRIRNAAFDVAARFVREQWPEIWKWIDQDKNGQIDWLESTLAGALPPVDHSKAAAAQAAAA